MPDPVATLRAEIDEWVFRLGGDDIHSIQHQVSDLLWRSAFYRSINESRKHLTEGNGSLHGLINEGFICLQASAVRRLVDRYSYDGTMGVNSLTNLIRDIRKASPLLSRSNILAARGLVYDYAPAREAAFMQSAQEARSRGETAGFVSHDGWFLSEYWHGVWDDLCGVEEANRLPTDRPPEAKLLQLESDLAAATEHVEEYSNKYIAHAASDGSRRTLTDEHQSLSLATIWKAERAIVRVTAFLTRCFGDGASWGGVPVPQFDQFEFLDLPFASRDSRTTMEGAWERHSNETEACRNWDWSGPLLSEADRWDGDNRSPS